MNKYTILYKGNGIFNIYSCLARNYGDAIGKFELMAYSIYRWFNILEVIKY